MKCCDAGDILISQKALFFMIPSMNHYSVVHDSLKSLFYNFTVMLLGCVYATVLCLISTCVLCSLQPNEYFGFSLLAVDLTGDGMCML